MYYMVIYADGDAAIWEDSPTPGWATFHSCPVDRTKEQNFVHRIRTSILTQLNEHVTVLTSDDIETLLEYCVLYAL